MKHVDASLECGKGEKVVECANGPEKGLTKVWKSMKPGDKVVFAGGEASCTQNEKRRKALSDQALVMKGKT